MKIATSITVEPQDLQKKKELGTPWSFIVKKGLEHLTTCQEQQQNIARNAKIITELQRLKKLEYYMNHNHKDTLNKFYTWKREQEAQEKR